MSEEVKNTTQEPMPEELKEKKLLSLLMMGKASHKLNIDDPVALYNNIKSKYHEHASDIIVNCITKPIEIIGEPAFMGRPARADDLLNYFSKTAVCNVDEKKLSRACGDENWAKQTINQAIESLKNRRDDWGK
jgi:hypothetical protein